MEFINKVGTHTISNGGTTVASMTYDIAGNQTSLTDQSAGTINYTYTKFGELKTQVTARDNNTTTLNYYDDGRLYTKVIPEGTTTYSYNGNKQLTSISSPGSVSRSQTYDSKGRVQNITETIDSNNYSTTFAYDGLGRVDTRTHPSGIVEKNIYDENTGYLEEIQADQQSMWRISTMDERQMVRTAIYGTGTSLNATFTPDSYGLLSSIQTGSVQDWRYSFNAVTGNLTSRQNYLRSKSESFGYDTGLYRLTSVTGPQNLTMTYEDNGDITAKSDFGEYTYDDHEMDVSNISETYASDQVITYTSFEKVNTISEGDYSAEFIYNADYDRAKMVVDGPNCSLTRIYAGSRYMKETLNSVTKEYTFIGGDAYTAPCVIEKSGLTTTPHFLLRDHLGSIIYVANNSGTIEHEYSYDAWGRQRNPTNWSVYSVDNEPTLFMGRGYTGHEHLPWFNLINMNGRLYDPVVGRFLSPDNYVSSPDYSQGYNRYAYCMNNPLAYSDPDGDNPILFAFLFGGLYNVIFNGKDIHGVGDVISGFIDGGVRSAFSAGVAMGVGNIFGDVGNLGHELLRAGAHGITGGGLSAIQGGDFWSGAAGGFAGSAGASLFGNFGLGRVGYGLSGAGSGALGSLAAGGNPWEGAVTGGIIGAFNHGQHEGDEILNGGMLPEVTIEGTNMNYSEYSYIIGAMRSIKLRGSLRDNLGQAYSLGYWYNSNKGLNLQSIINQERNRSLTIANSQLGGPSIRYVKDPQSNAIIDMRHMLIVGKYSEFIANYIEEYQYLLGQPSGRNIQDYFSNDLGRSFYGSPYGRISTPSSVRMFLNDPNYLYIRNRY